MGGRGKGSGLEERSPVDEQELEAHAAAMRWALERAAGEDALTFLAGGRMVLAAWRRLEPRLRAAYAAAGSPYGATDAGLWRWLRADRRVDRFRDDPALRDAWRRIAARLQDGLRDTR
jgi:hypothetical protein